MVNRPVPRTARRGGGGAAVAAGFAAAAALGAMPVHAAQQVSNGPVLQPHRAVYDLSLSEHDPSTNIRSAAGRLVYEVGGSACTGYTVDFRNVTKVTDRDGEETVTDLRSSTTETLDPPTLAFSHETHVGGTAGETVAGMAEARAAGVSVQIMEPKETTLELGRAIFPTAHTRLILDAAQSGERILEASVFDGGDEADAVYDTATVIRSGEEGLPGASPLEREVLSALPDATDRTAWRLVISYFESGGDGGESVPDYELTFTMLDNGISYDVAFDYGAFTLAGELTELTLGSIPDCPDE